MPNAFTGHISGKAETGQKCSCLFDMLSFHRNCSVMLKIHQVYFWPDLHPRSSRTCWRSLQYPLPMGPFPSPIDACICFFKREIFYDIWVDRTNCHLCCRQMWYLRYCCFANWYQRILLLVSVAHWHSVRWAWNGYQPAWVQSPEPAE